MVDWPQVSNWLVTLAEVSNLVINLIKAQKIKENYSKFSKIEVHVLDLAYIIILQHLKLCFVAMF